MPSSYAHHRFGTQVIPLMPADLRGPALRHRALFDMGLQGPDFLFFHSFFKKTDLFRLGSEYHAMTGTAFFTRACAQLRRHPSEGASAYLHGVLAHYCLDSICHPVICEVTKDTELGHSELETEFDRFLLAQDGCKKPREFNLGRHMQLKKEEFATVAAFYPEVSCKDVTECIRSMALAQQLLAVPTAAGYAAVRLVTGFAGRNTAGKVMTVSPNRKCDHLNQKLLALYEQALANFPAFLEQLSAHMAYGEPLRDHFSADFG